MSQVYQMYYGYALNVGVVEDLLKEEYVNQFYEEVEANSTNLPYPLYCFHDTDEDYHYIVFEQVSLGSADENPAPLKVYSFKEAAQMIYETFKDYIIDEEEYEGGAKEMILDLAKEFKHVSLRYLD